MADTIQNLDQLEDRLSEPTPEVVQTLGRLEGDLIELGVGGKMGPSLARMARRAWELAGIARDLDAPNYVSSVKVPSFLPIRGRGGINPPTANSNNAINGIRVAH